MTWVTKHENKARRVREKWQSNEVEAEGRWKRLEMWRLNLPLIRASLVAQRLKRLPPMRETLVWSLGPIPGLGSSPGEGNGNPLQYSYLENPMDWGAWWAAVHGVTKNRTWLSDFTYLLNLPLLYLKMEEGVWGKQSRKLRMTSKEAARKWEAGSQNHIGLNSPTTWMNF